MLLPTLVNLTQVEPRVILANYLGHSKLQKANIFLLPAKTDVLFLPRT